MANNLDDILNDDGTQVLPSVEEKSKELHDANAALLDKISKANDVAQTAANVDLLQQINERLSGNASKSKARPTTTADGTTAFDKVNVVYLVVGGLLGFMVGMIIVNLLQTELEGSRFDSVSFWVSALVVLMVTGFGVFLGSAAHDKWRK